MNPSSAPPGAEIALNEVELVGVTLQKSAFGDSYTAAGRASVTNTKRTNLPSLVLYPQDSAGF